MKQTRIIASLLAAAVSICSLHCAEPYDAKALPAADGQTFSSEVTKYDPTRDSDAYSDLALAEDKTNIIAGRIECDPGDVVQYPIYVTNNTAGFAATNLSLSYDPELKLSMEDGAPKGELGEVAKDLMPVFDVMGIDTSKPVVGMGTIGMMKNAAGDGEVFLIEFQIPYDAMPGTLYPMKLAIKEWKDKSTKAVDAVAFDGWIAISEEEVETSTTPITTTTTAEMTTTTAAPTTAKPVTTTAPAANPSDEEITYYDPLTASGAKMYSDLDFSTAITNIIGGRVECNPGDTVEYPVYVSNNTAGFGATGVQLSCDKDVSVVLNGDDNPDGYAGSWCTDKRTTTFADGSDETITKIGFGTVSAKDYFHNGLFFAVKLTIPENAEQGTVYPITVVVKDWKDKSSNLVDHVSFDGWIKVRGAAETTTTAPVTTTQRPETSLPMETTATKAPTTTTVTYAATTQRTDNGDNGTTTTSAVPSTTTTTAAPSKGGIVNANLDGMYQYRVDENLPSGCSMNDIYGIRATFDNAPKNDEETNLGAIAWSSDSTDWNQREFTSIPDDSFDRILIAADNTVTYLSDTPLFAAPDEWAAFYVQQWHWEDDSQIAFSVINMEMLGKDGEPLTARAAVTTTYPEYTETTATYATTTTVKKTGSTSTTVTLSQPRSMMQYDVNNNGFVDIADAVLLSRVLAEDETLIYSADWNLDVNSDDLVTVEDIIAVLRIFEPFSLKIGKASGKPGSLVKIPIQIYGDKGTAGGQVYISYDSRLTPVSVTAGDAYLTHFESDTEGWPLYLAWTSPDGQNQTAPDGAVLAYIEFEIDSNIPEIEYLDVSVLSQAGSNRTVFTDADGYTIPASYGRGYITVIP